MKDLGVTFVLYATFWLIFWNLYVRWFAWMERRPGPSVAPPMKDRKVKVVKIVTEWEPRYKTPLPPVPKVHPKCPTCTCKWIDPTGMDLTR